MDFEWLNDVGDWLGETTSNAFDYIGKNEWAANMLSGAAAGASAYMLQEDQQQHERDLLREKQRFEVDVNTIKPSAGVNVAAYQQGLMGGKLTNGLLSQKKV